MYTLPASTHIRLENSHTSVISISPFCRRFSDLDSTLLVLGDIYGLFDHSFSGPNDPKALPTLFENLIKNPHTTWTNLKGQCSCVWVSKGHIELFRTAFSPHLLFFNHNSVSDQLIDLATSPPLFSQRYLENFVLDSPSLQFSSTLTPLDGVFRLPPASIATLAGGAEPQIEYLTTEPYRLVESSLTFEQASLGLRNILREIIDWHLQKNKPVAAELSGGLDSSFVASFLADRSKTPVEALMYAYRKHPSHLFSEQCARQVAKEKQIDLKVVDSSEIAPVNLADPSPYQNEPVDFFWQGTLFGQICRDSIKPGSLLFTGFGCDQLLMRNNHIIRILARKKGMMAALSVVKELARAVNRPATNFSFQFLLSRIPQSTLVNLLDLTRQLKINPFKVDELVPEVLKTERVSWLIKEGKPLPAKSLLKLLHEGEKLESRFFEPDLPHANLNYLIAPQYVIQPYVASIGVEYIHPFCDARLIDFVFSQVPFSFIHDFKTPYKLLLRQAMQGITPEEVRIRPKDEFSFDGYFFSVLKANELYLRELFEEAIQEFPNWIEPRALRRSFESMLFGVFSNSEVKLSRLMSYLIWRHQFKGFLKKERVHRE